MTHHNTLWRLYDAMQFEAGGCAICGDQDEFSPNVESFEITGKLICSDCWESSEEPDQ